MKLIKVNKILKNIKLINVQGEVVRGKFLISPSHTTTCSLIFSFQFCDVATFATRSYDV
jgi:hypothetical protein